MRPITQRYLHMAAEMADGSTIVGQHLLTGKECSPIESPIKRVYLSKSSRAPKPVKVKLPPYLRTQIKRAELIVFPMGSFYSSILAPVLVHGTGGAVAENLAPKVYVPNTVPDPEQVGMSTYDSVVVLLDYLRKSGAENEPTHKLLNFVIVDTANGKYSNPVDVAAIERLGPTVLDLPVADSDTGLINEERLLQVLLSLT